jgi:hypothetical protein
MFWHVSFSLWHGHENPIAAHRATRRIAHSTRFRNAYCRARQDRVATGRPPLGREEVVLVRPGRSPGGCGGRRGSSALPGRESTAAGRAALMGRTVRSGKAPTAHPAGSRVGAHSKRTRRLRVYRSPPSHRVDLARRRCAGGGWAHRGARVVEDTVNGTRLGDQGDDPHRRYREGRRAGRLASSARPKGPSLGPASIRCVRAARPRDWIAVQAGPRERLHVRHPALLRRSRPGEAYPRQHGHAGSSSLRAPSGRPGVTSGTGVIPHPSRTTHRLLSARLGPPCRLAPIGFKPSRPLCRVNARSTILPSTCGGVSAAISRFFSARSSDDQIFSKPIIIRMLHDLFSVARTRKMHV